MPQNQKMKLHGLTPVASSPLASAERNPAEAENLRIHSRSYLPNSASLWQAGDRGFLRRRINPTKLYRSETDRVLGGVAGGLGEYFNIDPIILRLIFVLLGLNGGVLVYLILWLIIPAKSRLQAPSNQTLKSNADEIKVKAQALATDLRFETTKHNSQVWLGIAIIILGAVLLLGNFNLFRFFNIWRFWPLTLIALGIALWAKKND